MRQRLTKGSYIAVVLKSRVEDAGEGNSEHAGKDVGEDIGKVPSERLRVEDFARAGRAVDLLSRALRQERSMVRANRREVGSMVRKDW